MNYEGIIVFGMPRSGTTLLRKLINAHPDVYCPPETNVLNACSRMLYEEGFSDGLSIGMVSGLGFSGIEEQEVLERVRDFAFSFFRNLKELSGKRYWAEKTAFDCFHSQNIFRICGSHCRYVCLFRNPMDVVLSIQELVAKMETVMSELHDYVSRYPVTLEAYARAWADVNRDLIRFQEEHGDFVFSLRYEDLVLDPEGELARLFSFLGLPGEVEKIVAGAFGPSGDIGLGDWKIQESQGITTSRVAREEHVSPFARKRIADAVNEIAERLGYEPLKAEETVSGEEARRRYQIAKMVTRMKSGGE